MALMGWSISADNWLVPDNEGHAPSPIILSCPIIYEVFLLTIPYYKDIQYLTSRSIRRHSTKTETRFNIGLNKSMLG